MITWRSGVLAGILIACLAIPATLAQKPPTKQKPHTIAEVAWMAGCWKGMGEEEVLEQWMKPSGGTMLGMSRTVVGGRTVTYEFVLLREKDGDLYYTAKPAGQEEATFKLIQSGMYEAVFENPEHDFPQRISYRLRPDGTLRAVIEGTVGTETRRVEYPMKRVPCE